MKYAELVRAPFHLTDIILHHLQILVLDQVTLAPSSPGVNHFHSLSVHNVNRNSVVFITKQCSQLIVIRLCTVCLFRIATESTGEL